MRGGEVVEREQLVAVASQAGGATEERNGSGEPERLRALGTRTSTSPSPVRILRSGRRPLRTTRWRPSGSFS